MSTDPSEASSEDALEGESANGFLIPDDAEPVSQHLATKRRRIRDPREELSPRDVAALTFIGQCGEVAQYQLHEGVFGSVSEVVVSRFVRRATERGLIATTRWRGIGINRLRLTTRGRTQVTQSGVGEEAIFVLRNPVVDGHVEHQLWIVDLLIVLGRAERKPDLLLPAWALQRRFSPRPLAIPDVLVSFTTTPELPALLLGVEIDRGSENLASVFLPKLQKLSSVLSSWAGESPSAVVVLTNGNRRRDAIQRIGEALRLPLVVESLPTVMGRPGLAEMARILNFVR